MVAPIWAASLLQAWLDGRMSGAALAQRGGAVLGGIVALMLLTGQLGSDLGSAVGSGYGRWTLDPLSPFVPQLSAIPGLGSRWLDSFYQYEGYAYLGLGVLLLLAFNLPGIVDLWGRRSRRYAVLPAVFAAFLLFAISNRVDFRFFSFEIPVPYRLLYDFGVFRASGCFVWPVGYALAALAVFLTLRYYIPAAALALLGVAALQLADVAPPRAAMRASELYPAPPPLDRAMLATRLAPADAVMVIPTYLCDAAARNSRSPSSPLFLPPRALICRSRSITCG